MKHRTQQPVAAQGELVKYAQQGMPQLEVWLEGETIWLTQKQMAELFGVKEHTITYHIKGIVASGELEGMATTRKIRVVRFEGGRQVSRQIDYYNLEMIISVGYRVNSRRGVLFRRWATSVLKEYLLRGLVRDRRIGKLEKRMTAAERSIDSIIYTLMPPLTADRTPIGFGQNVAIIQYPMPQCHNIIIPNCPLATPHRGSDTPVASQRRATELA